MNQRGPFSERKGLTRRAFLVGAGGAALSSVVGYRLWNQFFPSIRFSSLSDIRGDQPFDVCILGSGPAGVTLGRDLVDRGMRTLMLESGGDVMDSSQGLFVEGLDVYRTSGAVSYPLITTRVRGFGGTSLLWTGRSSRFLPIDFEDNAYTPKGASWPIKYADLERYYDKAEKTLRVRGGPLSSYHAPRRRDLPPIEGMDISELQEQMKKFGIVVDVSPSSRAGGRYRGPVRVAREMLPSFSRSSRAVVVPNASATRIFMGKGGRVKGVNVKDLDGNEQMMRARTFVVACGAVETPRLLMLSRSSEFPNGVGNHSGLLGCFFMEHPTLMFSGRLPDHIQFKKTQLGRSFQYYEQFKQEGYGSVRLAFKYSLTRPEEFRIYATVEMWPTKENRVSLMPDKLNRLGDPGAELALNFSKEDERTFDHTRGLIRKIYSSMGVREVEEKPWLWGHHHMGTCRMGADPKTSVVDGNLRVHGTENLYVLGSSVFVTSGAAHPTLAIAALAHRLADHLEPG